MQRFKGRSLALEKTKLVKKKKKPTVLGRDKKIDYLKLKKQNLSEAVYIEL